MAADPVNTFTATTIAGRAERERKMANNECRRCNGTGMLGFRNATAIGLSSVLTAKCPDCDGTGFDFSENHQRCMFCGDYTDMCQCSGSTA